jgi:hypothetical protein
LKVVKAVAEGRVMSWRVAERLHVIVRQIERLVLRYRAHSARDLVSAKRELANNHRLPDGVAARALSLILRTDLSPVNRSP